jgi:hypothetical protein
MGLKLLLYPPALPLHIYPAIELPAVHPANILNRQDHLCPAPRLSNPRPQVLAPLLISLGLVH